MGGHRYCQEVDQWQMHLHSAVVSAVAELPAFDLLVAALVPQVAELLQPLVAAADRLL